MKNKLIKLAGAVAVVALTQTVQANTITGSIGFGGSFTPNGNGDGYSPNDLSTADSLSVTADGTTPGSGTGVFPVSPDPTLSFFNSNFDLNPANDFTGLLYTETVGSVTYSFYVQSEIQGTTLANSLSISGTGYMTDSLGDTASAGVFQINFGLSQAGDSGTSYTFAGTSAVFGQTASVPDGGTTVLLLGAALSGLALMKRKLTA